MKKMANRICNNKDCKDVKLSVLNENEDPMSLVCENCGRKHKALTRYVLCA